MESYKSLANGVSEQDIVRSDINRSDKLRSDLSVTGWDLDENELSTSKGFALSEQDDEEIDTPTGVPVPTTNDPETPASLKAIDKAALDQPRLRDHATS